MRRMIVHSEPEHRMGGEVYYREHEFSHDPELLEAYRCGHKDGRKEAYKEIMEEQYGGYNERHHYGRVGMPPMMREHDHGWDDDDEIVRYRRGRDSMGRYIHR